MAQKKAHEVDSWLARPSTQAAIVLIYGPDRGLVAERARAFAAKTDLPLDDPFSVARLDGSELEKDAGRLLDEARTVPMFSTRRLLWVRNAAGQKALSDDVKVLCAEPPRDATILIEAGDLKKGAALRSAVETSEWGMALPCYADEAKGIDSVIDEELQSAGMSLTLEARQVLRRNLGGDRLASRGEIRKLVLYAMGRKQIELDDVKAAIGDASGLSYDDAIDAVLEGRVDEFDSIFARHTQSGGPPFLLLAAAMRQFQAIQLMRGAMEEGGRTASAAVASARPPIFFSRRTLMENALKRWDGNTLARCLTRLQEAVLQTRRRPNLSVAIARQALLGIALEASRLKQRRG
ncbi:DNA polymerase III subunit delta [Pseudaminobacter sp. NGMCC 1.201702]|uniref:DNA polymerase III subunit delta n=1 Tax=Pseudaminobacter sp. NGMCC 1.201702 TaxID=3391825 RepID=UPI0039F10061